MEMLLEMDADVNKADVEGWTALHFAADRKRKKFAVLLIKAGANINATTTDGVSPLDLAIWHGFEETEQQLLEAGAVQSMDDFGLDWLFSCRVLRHPPVERVGRADRSPNNESPRWYIG